MGADREPLIDQAIRTASQIQTRVLDELKSEFIGKDEVIDLLGVSLVAGENLFLLGPPGTAKSALVQSIAGKLHGRSFDYLLTRFTEPGELFGPFDIRKLREGELLTNTEGMLPEADFIFLDELLNANSAILNSLLMALNERMFRRGRETRSLQFVMTVGASNRLPEDEALAALFDRFLLRVRCDNVPGDQLESVLTAGWKLQQRTERPPAANQVSADDVRQVQQAVALVDVTTVRARFAQMVLRFRNAGIQVSDRRAVRLQRLVAASALMCGRQQADTSDLWVARYTWDTAEQVEVLQKIVSDVVADRSTVTDVTIHPRASAESDPDPERLAADLGMIEAELDDPHNNVDRQILSDRLNLLAGRIEWIRNAESRRHLQEQVSQLFDRLKSDNV